MAFIDTMILNVAAPKFAERIAGFYRRRAIESYGLFPCSLILVGGALGDWLGRRLVFLLGAGVFAIASVACGLAPSKTR